MTFLGSTLQVFIPSNGWAKTQPFSETYQLAPYPSQVLSSYTSSHFNYAGRYEPGYREYTTCGEQQDR